MPHFKGASWEMYAMVAGGLAIIYLFPRVTKAVPSPLVAIIVITIIAIATGAHIRTMGDLGEISPSLPSFLLPHVPVNFKNAWNDFSLFFGNCCCGID